MAPVEKQTDQELTIEDPTVIEKYRIAGDVVNRTLQAIVKECVAGASVKEICQKGDNMLMHDTGKKYKHDEDMKKGIAFPTCLSVNNCICHFSPARNDPDYLLKENDVVKIDMGAHIDGFIAVAAHTIVVGATPENKCKGRAADVVLAAYHASQAALRLLKAGTGNYAVTDAVQKIASDFKCKPIEGMLSHQLKQFKIDGEKTIIQNPTIAQKKEHEKCDFEKYEVYAMDVLISTGEGLGKEHDTRVAIYKKTDENYMLKLKASRAFIGEVKKKYGTMPFNLRNFEEEAKAKLGVNECVTHKMVEPFQVLYEKHNEYVAQFKYTVLITANGKKVVTGHPFDENCYESEHSVQDEEMKNLLAGKVAPQSGAKAKKKRNRGKKNKGAAAGAADEEEGDSGEEDAPAATADKAEAKA
uniref:Peptidase M24 domain-containing protein n=1 Tax=Anopheles quadriannulatus TaxID=34691 RepID=A0A182XJ80_ANOQN